MKKTTFAAEVLSAAAMQYGLSRLLAAATSRAEDREEVELGSHPLLVTPTGAAHDSVPA